VKQILNGDNPCSSFFQGSTVALAAFKVLVRLLQTDALGSQDSDVGIRLSGPWSNGPGYRIPTSATINTNSPLYSSRTTLYQWVVALLHELAHMVEKNGDPLIPHDGGNGKQSQTNTKTVADACWGQISGLPGAPSKAP
jgi:hypothetical protein